MEALLQEAESLHSKIKSHDISSGPFPDQKLWSLEKHLSLGSFLHGFAGLEAFVHNVRLEFKRREPSDLPDSFFGKQKRVEQLKIKKDFEWWPITEKVFFIPSLCCDELKAPSSFFKKNSKKWHQFAEIVSVRNSIAHAKPVDRKMTITLKPDKIHEADDSHKSNFRPCTQIPKDLRIFNYECASKARDIIVWVRDRLVESLDRKITPEYFTDEILQIID